MSDRRVTAAGVAERDDRTLGKSTAWLVTVSALALLVSAAPSLAQSVTTTGDVDPGPASSPTWAVGGGTITGQENLTVGSTGSGTLTVEGGGSVYDWQGFIGYYPGSAGAVTVTGPLSHWENNRELFVGMSGTGTLTVAGGGSVYSGSSSVIGADPGSQGTVTVTGSASSWAIWGGLVVGDLSTGTLTVENGGAVSNGLIGYIGDRATGTGTVTVSGPGSSWTNGTELYVGHNGTGSLSIDDGGLVSVGTGTVRIATYSTSAGTINVGASAGQAAVAAGTLAAGRLIFGAGSGTLVFNHTGLLDGSDLSFAPVLSGVGSVDHRAGTTVMTGDSSAFSGTTTISGGKLVVGSGGTGRLGGTINVMNGGSLGGTGALGTTTIAAGGMHAPGNSIGNQAIAGDYTNHGTLQIEANPTGADKLIVTGAVDITGATLSLLLTPTSVASWDIANSPFTYTIIDNDSADAVTGQFGSIDDLNRLLFLTASLSYVAGDGNDVALRLQRGVDFASVASTGNQAGVAGAIQGMNSGPLFDAIVVQSDADLVRASFDALSGEAGAATKGTLGVPGQQMANAATDRLTGAFSDMGGTPVLAYGETGPELAAPDTLLSVAWGSAFGGWGTVDADGGAAAMSTHGGGLAGGMDGQLGDWRLGMMASYARSGFDIADRASSGTSDSYSFGLYGGTTWNGLAFRSGIVASSHSVATKRDVVIPGFTDHLSAEYGARSLQAFAELAYAIELSNATALEPFANLAQARLDTDSYTEAGGAAALTSAATTANTTFTTIGLRASHKVAMGTVLGTFHAMAGWRHGFGDLTPTSSMSFAGSTPFSVSGAAAADETALLSSGLDLNLTETTTIGLNYSGWFAKGSADNSASASLAVNF